MLRKLMLSSIVALALLTGCDNNNGEKFLGKWVSINSENRTVVIVRNGDSFLIRETAPVYLGSKLETTTIPAMLKDGSLQVQTRFGLLPLAIDDSTGVLIDGQYKYVHAN